MISLNEAIEKLRKKEISSTELTEECLKNLKEKNSDLNIFTETYEVEALKQAKEIDNTDFRGKPFPDLTGIPYTLKDIFNFKGTSTTCSSKILDGYISPFDASSCMPFREQNSVLIGKVNMDEFACGSSTEHSAYGVTKNPWNSEFVSGGSSGGSAAAVAAGTCLFSMGTDTGGSIRQPAAFCGVVGLKPTYGRVSRFGAIAMASSWDCIGPLTRTVEDSAIVLNNIAGLDKFDSTTVDVPVPDYTACLKAPLDGLVCGVPKEYFSDTMDMDVVKGIEETKKVYEKLGVTFKEVSLPNTKYALSVYYIIMPAELSTNLSRFDGIRFGAQAKSEDLLSHYVNTRGEGFGPEIKRRIMMGTFVLSEGYLDAYYRKAQKVRTIIIEEFNNVFKDVDVLLAPVVPTKAFKIGEKNNNPLEMYMADINTIPASAAGLPALSIPCGIGENNLPLAFQLIAPQFNEERILNMGHQYQLFTDFEINKL